MVDHRRTPKCKFCGFRFRFAPLEKQPGEIPANQISPWRCTNCNAVYGYRNPDKPERGYVVQRRPDPGGYIMFTRKKRKKRG